MKTMVSTAVSGGSGAIDSSDILPAGAKAGPWQVERELGRGGMGAVYAVVHDEIGKRAALKVVHQRLLVPGFNSDRMMLEAKVVNQVGHPNIVDIFETGKLDDGRPYIVMERLEGQSLSARADEGKLLPDLVIGVLLQMCDALSAAHKAGVIHRDLKPDNVFLIDNADDPTMPKVKLLDWGIAKVLTTDVKHTIEGQLVGTPQYLAPEQARGHEVSPQTDVYSLGVMAYELFLEQLPFEAETAAEVMAMHLRATPPPPSDLWPDMPDALENLLLAMLSKQAAHRPTVADVARQLETVRGELVRRREAHHPTRIPTVRPPTGPTTGPIDPEAPLRLISSGFAPTEPALVRRPRARRWQYALGGCALAASMTMLFWIGRVGDRSASAAPLDVASGVHQATPIQAAQPALISDLEPKAAAAPPLEVVAKPVAAAPIVRAAPARPAASRIAPVRKPPVAPRRTGKLDPNGVIDPY